MTTLLFLLQSDPVLFVDVLKPNMKIVSLIVIAIYVLWNRT
jgi:hypothetical protein